jgi:hypothetical protein
MTKFAIDDRLDDVDIHLGGRFDPRHLGSYLCQMEEPAIFDRTGSCGKPLGLIVGRRAVKADEVPGVLRHRRRISRRLSTHAKIAFSIPETLPQLGLIGSKLRFWPSCGTLQERIDRDGSCA